jgi:hypothetical protein
MSERVLRSEVLARIPGVVHGFSTRRGGVSEGRFASLNLGQGFDDRDRVDQNRARFAEDVGARGPLHEVEQVHGTRVVFASDSRPSATVQADGVGVERPDRFAGVRTADCVPVLLVVASRGPGGAAKRCEAAVAVHAGWRGATQGILRGAVGALRERGARPEQIWAALGPAISVDAFEVGEEVIEAARVALGGEAPPAKPGSRGRPRLDLPDTVRRLLDREGIGGERVDRVRRCTHAEPATFFSYRRDGAPTGSMLSVVGWTSSTSP